MFSRFFRIFFLLTAAFAAASSLSWRELQIPEEELPMLLESWPQATLLSRAEFDALVQQNRLQRDELPPRNAAFTRLDSRITVHESRAFVEMQLQLTVLEDGWQSLSPGGDGIRWQQVNHPQGPAFCSLDEQDRLQIQLQKGTHQLLLLGEIPVSTDATKRQLTFALPKAASGTLQLDVPGDVVLHSGATLLSRHFDTASGNTLFKLLPEQGMRNLILSLNSRFQQNEQLLLAESSLACYLSENEERLEADVHLDIRHHPLNEFRLKISPDFEVLSVQADAGRIASWEMRSPAELVVHFTKAQTGTVNLQILAVRRECNRPEAWTFPEFRPLDCFSAGTRAVLLKHPRLRIDKLRGSGLQFLSRQSHTLPADTADFEYVAAFAAAGAFHLTAESIRVTAAGLETTLQQRWFIREKHQELQLLLSLAPKAEDLFQLEIILPPEWQKADSQGIQPVLMEPLGKSLPVPEFTLDATGQEKGHFLILFPKSLPAGQTFVLPLTFTAVPQNWFQAWTEPRNLKSPVLRIDKVRWRGGNLHVFLQDDLQASLLNTENCQALNQASAGLQAFAFRCTEAPGQAEFAVNKISSRLSAETYSWYKVERDHLKVCHEITWQIRDAALRQLSFELPANVPEAISITGEDGQAREFSYTRNEKRKYFTVQLKGQAFGRERLVILYQIPHETDAQRLLLPALSAEQASPFSGRIAIEGQADLEVQLFDTPRKIDPGELASVLHKPGKHLLGVFAFSGNPPAMELLCKEQNSGQLPACLAEKIEASLLFSPASPRQIAVKYTLQTNLPAVGIRLPQSASLWSASVDDKPAILLRQGADYLLQFPADKLDSRRNLLLVFELPPLKISHIGSTTGTLPRLFYQAAGQSRIVPAANVRWSIHYPGNWQPLACFGDVSTRQLPGNPGAAAMLGKLLYRWSGGITPAHGCAGCLLSSLASGRQKAMQTVQHAKMESMKSLEQDYVLEESVVDADGFDKRSDKLAAPSAMKPGAKIRSAREEKQEVMQKGMPSAYRSLQIQLLRSGEAIHLDSLDSDRAFRLLLVDIQTWKAVRRLGILLVFLLGFLPCFNSWRRRLSYIAFILLGSSLLPLLPALEMGTALFNALFVSAFMLLLLYLLLSGAAKVRARHATLLLLAGTLLLNASAQAQEPAASKPPLVRIQNFQPQPIPLPGDAIIVPYSGEQPGNQVLIPFEFYQQLKKGSGITAPAPPPFLLSGIEFRCNMQDIHTENLRFEGTFKVRIQQKGPVQLPPLPFSGAVLEDLRVNGQPDAHIWQQDSGKGRQLRIALSEPGEYSITLALSCPVTKQSGWRRINACLPAYGASRLLLENLPEGTALSVDSGNGPLTLREPTGIPVVFALQQSPFTLQWRPETGPAEIDRTLTVDSIIGLTLTPARQRIFWEPAFSFSDQGRSVFDLEIPQDWQLEGVTGENVRGWEKRSGAERQRLSVHLFKPAEKQEKFRLILLAQNPQEFKDAREFVFPALTVPSAARHQSVLLIDTPQNFSIRSTGGGGCRRTSFDPHQPRLLAAFPELKATFRPFEAWECTRQPLPLSLQLLPQKKPQEATLQLLQTVSPDAIRIEGCFVIQCGLPARVEQSILLPANFELLEVHAADLLDWQIDSDNPLLLLLRFDGNQSPERKILFRGQSLRKSQPGMQLPILSFQLQDSTVQQSWIVVQTWEPWQLQEEHLENLESCLLQEFSTWLKRRAPVSLAFKSKKTPYAGTLQIKTADKKISGITLLSCKFTEKALEESLLFDLHCAGGISEFTFQVPKYWQNARPQQPFLSSYESKSTEDTVTFTLHFQTPLSGQLRILLEQDRQPEAEIPVQLPKSSWPLTTCLLLENSGRDEVSAGELNGLSEWNMQAALPDFLRSLLKGPNRQAWLATDSPAGLIFHLRERHAVETAGARIGLSSAILLLDAGGSCRAEQTFHIDNRTEQFLELQLPPGSELWTAKVAGELVKPIRTADNADNRFLLPLVKTAEGDLDYQIILTWSAQLQRPGYGANCEFPFIKPVNINIERSLVELRLPVEQCWFAFGGSLGKKVDRETWLGSQLTYQNSQAQRLQQALQSSNIFSQQRAFGNIGKLDTAMQKNLAEVSSLNQQTSIVSGAQQQLQQLQQQIKLSQTGDKAIEDTRQQLLHYNQQQAPVSRQPEQLDNWNPEDFKSPEAPDSELLKDTTSYERSAKRQAEKGLPAKKSMDEKRKSDIRWRNSEPVSQVGNLHVEAAPAPAVAMAPADQLVKADYDAASPVITAALNQASLEMQLPPHDPQRWQVLHFSSPRGVEHLYGRCIQRKSLDSWLNLAYTLLISTLILAAATLFSKHGMQWIPAGLRRKSTLRWLAAVSILVGILPLLGILLLILSFTPLTHKGK